MFFKRIFSAYSRSLQKRPTMTKIVTTGVIYNCGDIMAQNLSQYLEERKNLPTSVAENDDFFYSHNDKLLQDPKNMIQKPVKKVVQSYFDWYRLARMSFFGFCIFGPYLNFYFIALERLVPSTLRFANLRKLFVDQPVGASIFCLGFITYNTLAPKIVNGSSSSSSELGMGMGSTWINVKEAIRFDFWKMLKANWTVWPAVNFITFRFIPFDYRVAFVNIVSLFWSCLLSFLFSSSSSAQRTTSSSS